MKLTIDRSKLLKACQLVSVAVPTRTTKPILASIKAVTKDNTLTLTATDLEVGINHTVREVDVAKHGAAIWPVAKLVEILRNATDESLVVETDDKSCRVSTLSAEFEMPSEDVAAFPDVQPQDGGTEITIDQAVLQKTLRRIRFATAKQDTKFAITGVCIEPSTHGLVFAATDTRRLAMATCEQCKVDDKQKYLIPSQTIELLGDSIPDGGEPANVNIRLGAQQASFVVGDTTIVSRLLEGRYPPYRDILPKKTAAAVELPRGAFASLLRQAKIMTDKDTIRVLLLFSEEKLVASAQSADVGKSNVAMPITCNCKFQIAFDPNYVLEMLKAIDEDVVTFKFTASDRPAVFEVGADYKYLVMPLV